MFLGEAAEALRMLLEVVPFSAGGGLMHLTAEYHQSSKEKCDVHMWPG